MITREYMRITTIIRIAGAILSLACSEATAGTVTSGDMEWTGSSSAYLQSVLCDSQGCSAGTSKMWTKAGATTTDGTVVTGSFYPTHMNNGLARCATTWSCTPSEAEDGSRWIFAPNDNVSWTCSFTAEPGLKADVDVEVGVGYLWGVDGCHSSSCAHPQSFSSRRLSFNTLDSNETPTATMSGDFKATGGGRIIVAIKNSYIKGFRDSFFVNNPVERKKTITYSCEVHTAKGTTGLYNKSFTLKMYGYAGSAKGTRRITITGDHLTGGWPGTIAIPDSETRGNIRIQATGNVGQAKINVPESVDNSAGEIVFNVSPVESTSSSAIWDVTYTLLGTLTPGKHQWHVPIQIEYY